MDEENGVVSRRTANGKAVQVDAFTGLDRERNVPHDPVSGSAADGVRHTSALVNNAGRVVRGVLSRLGQRQLNLYTFAGSVTGDVLSPGQRGDKTIALDHNRCSGGSGGGVGDGELVDLREFGHGGLLLVSLYFCLRIIKPGE